MAWQEVRKGRGKGGSGLQASSTAMQNSMAQLAASIQNTYPPQGKGGPPQGKGASKGGGKGNGKGGERKAENLLREGDTYNGGSAMHRLPNLQLDNPQCMQILRPETASGASRNKTATPVPWTIFLLCGILWLILCQCCQRILRPGRRTGKGQSPHDTKGRKSNPHSGDSPRVRPSQRGVPEPAGPVAQRSQRSAPTRSQARLGHCQTTESGSEGAKMQRSREAGRRGFACCPRRESGVRLRVESHKIASPPPPPPAEKVPIWRILY